MKLYLILLSLLVMSCKATNRYSSSKVEYFEGVVTYKIDFEPKNAKILESQLKENIGSKMEMYFKEGNYLKRTFSPSGVILSEIYLDLDKNKSYNKLHNNDTIYWVDISHNDSKTTFNQRKDTIILNQSAIGLETSTVVQGPGFGDNSFELTGEIYFSKNLKVNPLWYKNYLEGNFNEQIKIGKGIQLLYINNSPLWVIKRTATMVKHRKILDNEILFKYSKDSVLKEL